MSFFNEHSRTDYINFKNYCDNYRFPIIESAAGEQKVREIHKQIYKFYYIHSCIENENNFLKETVSDLLSVMFMARQGVIKGAMVILRSSIENFMRYVINVYLNDDSLIKSTLVLPLFEKTKDFFHNHVIIKTHVDKLYSNYKYLCRFSHSALTEFQSQNMTLTEISNLNIQDLEKVNKYVGQTVNSFIAIITYCFYIIDKKNSYNISNYRRSEFLELIPKEVYEIIPVPL